MRSHLRPCFVALACLLAPLACSRSAPEPTPASTSTPAPSPTSSAHPQQGSERALRAHVDALPLELDRIGAAAAFDPKRGLLYVWGGATHPLRPGGKPLRADPGLLEVIDLRAGRGAQVRLVGNGPAGVHVPAMAFDPHGTGALYVFGGWPEARRTPSDTLHRIDLAKSQPTVQLAPKTGNGPSARNGAAMVCDGEGKSLWLFGGDAATGPKGTFHPEADLWRYDLEGMKWEQVTAGGTPPPARWHAAMAIDESGRKAYLFGGAGEGATAFDARLYQLDLTTREWSALPAAGDSPPSLQGTTLTFDTAEHALVVAGGLRNEPPGAAVPGMLWWFGLDAGRWHKSESAAPLTRRDHVAAYDPETGAHVLLGGQVSQKVGNFYEIGDFVKPGARVQLKPQP
jgi:hypothetical protein